MGCAIGTISVPAYTNIFMAQVEAKHIYPYIHGKALLFLRYIDDIFMIWNGTTEELIFFIDDLNKKRNIKFDYEISTKQIELLETIVYRDNNTKFRRQYSINQQTNKHTCMHDRIILNLLKTVFHTGKLYA